MEAIIKYDFEATSEDELSIQKGLSIKIISKDIEPGWFKAELDGREGMIPANHVEMKPHRWYHESMSREESDGILEAQPVGTFVIRTSKSLLGQFSLSVTFAKGVGHFKILRSSSDKFYIWDQTFEYLNDLVDYYRSKSISLSENVKLLDLQPDGVKAIFDFPGTGPEDLVFKKGDVIKVTDHSDDDWWAGTLDEKTGQFPSTYVVPHCRTPLNEL